VGGERPGVPMVHLECHTCGMTATCVVTASTELAWLDHMETHSAKFNYSAWTWSVVSLFEGSSTAGVEDVSYTDSSSSRSCGLWINGAEPIGI